MAASADNPCLIRCEHLQRLYPDGNVAAVAEGTYKFAAGYPWAIQQSVPIECLRENMPNNEAPLSTSNQALTELQAGESYPLVIEVSLRP